MILCDPFLIFSLLPNTISDRCKTEVQAILKAHTELSHLWTVFTDLALIMFSLDGVKSVPAVFLRMDGIKALLLRQNFD